MIPKQNRIFMFVIALLVLILAFGYFLLNPDDNDGPEIEENRESKEVPYPPLQLLKPKETKHS